MKVLTTGSFGFVGVNLLAGLASNPDVTVVATDIHAPDAETLAFLQAVISRIKTVYLDVTDRAALHGMLRTEGITHVVHAAALTPTAEQERERPTAVVDVNLGGTINMLDVVAGSSAVERALIVSSSGVYGSVPSEPMPVQREDVNVQVENLYGITKLAGEMLAGRYRQLCGKPIAAVRLGSIYGPMERVSGSRPRLSHVGQLAHALRAGREITVAGPEIRRDWVYSGEVAEAIWALMTASEWRHNVYNIGSGQTIAFRDVVEAFLPYGLAVRWVADADEAEASMAQNSARAPLDINRIQADTEWRPTTLFAQGVAAMLSDVNVQS